MTEYEIQLSEDQLARLEQRIDDADALIADEEEQF